MMKKLKILGAALFATVIGMGIFAFGTIDDAPQKVRKAFAKKFPNIKKVKWEKESDLETYRNTELFKGVWATTKPMFASKAGAWSVDTHCHVAL